MAILKTEQWRDLILRHVWEEHELHLDTLHEGAEGDEDLQAAEGALDRLVQEGYLMRAPDGVVTCPVGGQSWLATLVMATSPRPLHPNRA